MKCNGSMMKTRLRTPRNTTRNRRRALRRRAARTTRARPRTHCSHMLRVSNQDRTASFRHHCVPPYHGAARAPARLRRCDSSDNGPARRARVHRRAHTSCRHGCARHQLARRGPPSRLRLPGHIAGTSPTAHRHRRAASNCVALASPHGPTRWTRRAALQQAAVQLRALPQAPRGARPERCRTWH